jgi:nicotinamide-nucleotide adenylyltransferase
MTVALIIGRFQPFHLGHLRLIEEAAKEADHIIIGIGSSQCSGTENNPFTADERRKMIEASIPKRIKHSVHEITDIGNDKLWVFHVNKIVPKFEVVYTNGELERRLFKEAGYGVHATGLYNRDKFSGTEVRRRIRAEQEWESLVPEGTKKILKEIGGEERIKSLASAQENK